jgi:predicted neutral ceramidase superfamily lipid hydrolase
LVAGILDISSAFIISYLKGGDAISVLHGVATGLVGRESAIAGGLATAALGLAIHFFIAFVVATVFYLASRRLVFLTQHAVISGLLYGVVVYGFMYWVVMPLAYPVVHPSLLRDLIAVCVHMLLIGLPIALIVRRYSRPQLPVSPKPSEGGSTRNSQLPQ